MSRILGHANEQITRASHDVSAEQVCPLTADIMSDGFAGLIRACRRPDHVAVPAHQAQPSRPACLALRWRQVGTTGDCADPRCRRVGDTGDPCGRPVLRRTRRPLARGTSSGCMLRTPFRGAYSSVPPAARWARHREFDEFTIKSPDSCGRRIDDGTNSAWNSRPATPQIGRAATSGGQDVYSRVNVCPHSIGGLAGRRALPDQPDSG